MRITEFGEIHKISQMLMFQTSAAGKHEHCRNIKTFEELIVSFKMRQAASTSFQVPALDLHQTTQDSNSSSSQNNNFDKDIIELKNTEN